MQHRIVSIVTGWGSGLGTGHVQRMASLASFLNRSKGISAFLVAGRKPDFLPFELHDCFLPSIKPGTGCIIRDMRDSSEEEMRELKKIGSVVTIDDCGPGRRMADAAIDLLPNPENRDHKKESFIYGYNFIDSLRKLNEEHIEKNLDALLYCGYKPAAETVDFIHSLIPRNKICAVLHGMETSIISGGMAISLSQSYAETILSARVLISHFGIALYEGYACGCRLVCVNPTGYHSQLADIAGNDIDAVNLGLLSEVDRGKAQEIISNLIDNPTADRIDPRAVCEKIEAGLERFYEDIKPYLDG